MRDKAVLIAAAVLLGGISWALAGNGTYNATPGSGVTFDTVTDGTGGNLPKVVVCDGTAGASCQSLTGTSSNVNVTNFNTNGQTNNNGGSPVTISNQQLTAAGSPSTTQVMAIQGETGMTAVNVAGTGVAGTPNAGVMSVQGISSMTPLSVSAGSGSIASGALAAGSIASGAVASGAVASGAYASGSIAVGALADGADTTEGAKADGACGTDTGTCSVVALIKKLNTLVDSPIQTGTNVIGSVGPAASAANGWTPKWFIAANTDNATNLKASAGVVHAVEVYGIGSAPAYLKFYDTSTTPTCGSSTIVKQIMIPAASTAANGAGSNAIVMDVQFSTGISYCVVTGIGSSDDTSPAASTFVINIDYK